MKDKDLLVAVSLAKENQEQDADANQYDAQSKKLWRFRKIIAPVLQRAIREYQGLTADEVADLIDADKISVDDLVSDVPVRPEAFDQPGTEDVSYTEKLLRYDIRLRAKDTDRSTEDTLVMLHVDFEVQNDYKPKNPSYPITKRAVYYAARELSGLLNYVTYDTDYSKLEKVYSIWICNENIPAESQGTMDRFYMQREHVIGECNEPEAYHDLMEVVIIRRGDDVDEIDGLFRYISGVFSGDLETIREYVGINTVSSEDTELEKEVNSMTGMGASLIQKGMRIEHERNEKENKAKHLSAKENYVNEALKNGWASSRKEAEDNFEALFRA